MDIRTPLAVLAAAALVLAACGDDDDDATDSAAAYCELSAELNDQADEVTDAQFDELLDVAPDEIRDEIETLVGAVRSEDFSDEAHAASQAVTEYEEANCGGDLAGGADDDEVDDEPPAIVTFVNLSDGDTVSNPIVIEANVIGAEVEPAGEVVDGKGHLHVMIDTDCLATGESIPSDDGHVHFGDGSTTLALPELSPGEHTLCLQLGDGVHNAFGATTTITVTVE